MKHVKVGMWELPGLLFPDDVDEQTMEEMKNWAKENHCGYCANSRMWSFKSDAQRDWFILRWIDRIPKEKSKEE
jgi:hypothetical protein